MHKVNLKSAFLIVDLQKAWAESNPLTTRDIEREAKVARRKNVAVVWTFIGLMPPDTPAMSYRELKVLPEYKAAVKRARPEMRPAITPHDDDMVIFKSGRNLFANPQAAPLFRDRLQVSDIGLGGFKASDCITATGRSGAKKGFEIRIKRELTADRMDNCETSLPVLLRGTDVQIGNFTWA